MHGYGKRRKTAPEGIIIKFTQGREITSDDEELDKKYDPPKKEKPRKSYYLEPKKIMTNEKIITREPKKPTEIKIEEKTPKYSFARKKKIETKLDVNEQKESENDSKSSEEEKPIKIIEKNDDNQDTKETKNKHSHKFKSRNSNKENENDLKKVEEIRIEKEEPKTYEEKEKIENKNKYTKNKGIPILEEKEEIATPTPIERSSNYNKENNDTKNIITEFKNIEVKKPDNKKLTSELVKKKYLNKTEDDLPSEKQPKLNFKRNDIKTKTVCAHFIPKLSFTRYNEMQIFEESSNNDINEDDDNENNDNENNNTVFDENNENNNESKETEDQTKKIIKDKNIQKINFNKVLEQNVQKDEKKPKNNNIKENDNKIDDIEIYEFDPNIDKPNKRKITVSYIKRKYLNKTDDDAQIEKKEKPEELKIQRRAKKTKTIATSYGQAQNIFSTIAKKKNAIFNFGFEPIKETKDENLILENNEREKEKIKIDQKKDNNIKNEEIYEKNPNDDVPDKRLITVSYIKRKYLNKTDEDLPAKKPIEDEEFKCERRQNKQKTVLPTHKINFEMYSIVDTKGNKESKYKINEESENSKNNLINKKNEKERQKELERQKEVEKLIELEKQKEVEKQKELEKQKEAEKQKELEKQKEEEKQKELENQKKLEKQREKEEAKKQREIEKQKEKERQEEIKKQKLLERQEKIERRNEMKRQREMERQKELKKQQEKEEQEELEIQEAEKQPKKEKQEKIKIEIDLEKKPKKSNQEEIEKQKDIKLKMIKAESKKRHEKYDRLDAVLNEVEKSNIHNKLSEDLAEIYGEVLKNVQDFKENLFFKNLLDTQKHVGIFDKNKKITHDYKDVETSKIIKKYQTSDDLLKKYKARAKKIDTNFE